MTTTTASILDDVWIAKDRLSAATGHDLAATCRAIYAEQEKHEYQIVNLGRKSNATEEDTDQPAPLVSTKPKNKKKSGSEPESQSHSFPKPIDLTR